MPARHHQQPSTLCPALRSQWPQNLSSRRGCRPSPSQSPANHLTRAAAAAQQQQYSSGAGASSIQTKYKVNPCGAKAGFKTAKITERSGHLGPKPPLWPVPLATGQWFTSSFEPCRLLARLSRPAGVRQGRRSGSTPRVFLGLCPGGDILPAPRS